MTDVIHDFTLTEYQKNPSEEFFVLWTFGAQSDIFKKMMASFFFASIPKTGICHASFM